MTSAAMCCALDFNRTTPFELGFCLCSSRAASSYCTLQQQQRGLEIELWNMMSYGSDQSRVISFWLEDIHQRRVTTLAVEASIIQIDFGTKFFTAMLRRKVRRLSQFLKGPLPLLDIGLMGGFNDLEFHVLIIKFWLYWSLVSGSKLDERRHNKLGLCVPWVPYFMYSLLASQVSFYHE